MSKTDLEMRAVATGAREQVSAYSIDSFCRAYSIGRTLAFAEMKAGRLKARKAGRRTLILREDAEAWATGQHVKTIRSDMMSKSAFKKIKAGLHDAIAFSGAKTAFADKFAEQGMLAHEVKFNIAISELLNNGGSIERARALIDAVAEKMGSVGHAKDAFTGRTQLASASRLDDGGKGHAKGAVKAITAVPSPPSPERSAGQGKSADKAVSELPVAANQRDRAGPSRPAGKAAKSVHRSVSPSYVAAAKKAAKTIALTVLDSYKVRDGRSIGDLILGDLASLRAANAMEMAVIGYIQRHAGNATANQLVRDVIKPVDLERFIQKAAEFADAI